MEAASRPQMFGGRRVLVTGCAGFIGSHLAESLLTDRAEVIGIDCFNDNDGRRENLRNLRQLTQVSRFSMVVQGIAR